MTVPGDAEVAGDGRHWRASSVVALILHGEERKDSNFLRSGHVQRIAIDIQLNYFYIEKIILPLIVFTEQTCVSSICTHIVTKSHA